MSRNIQELLADKLTRVEQDRMDMYINLMDVIKCCGGNPECFAKHIKDGMTVSELIDSLAQNGVRFIW